MGKVLYLECNSGISGDMTVGALLDLGADQAVLEHALESLNVGGYHLHFGRKVVCGLDAYDFDVHLEEEGHHHDHHHDHVHRNLDDIYAIIDRLDSNNRVKDLARTMFHIVAQAEAKAHGLPIHEVHFHEVGAIDSIVDIISVAVCIDNLGIEEVVVSPLAEGQGYVHCQHGVLPVPVPATANIVSAYGLQIHFTDNQGEMVTPTGAAIAATLRTRESLPSSYRLLKIGMGAGTKEFKQANILRAMLLETEEEEEQRLWVMETNLDDCTGEALGFVMDKLFENGALDVWYTPVFMKKNRPAYLLSVLSKETDLEALEGLILNHTTTIGIRRYPVNRTTLTRSIQEVETLYGVAKVKVCGHKERTFYYPEYESVRNICDQTGIDFQSVYCEIRETAKKDTRLQSIKERLEAQIASLATKDICLAFSGGVDSSLLLKLCAEAAERAGTTVYAVTFDSRLHPSCDLEIARKVAEELGGIHSIITVDELEQKEIRQNPVDRCYLCKRHLFHTLKQFAKEKGIHHLIDGTNEDDMHVYRPGIQALKELEILSPLADLHITKEEVKKLAAEYGISVASRPSTPCMATRIPYNTEIDYEVLERIGTGESWLRERFLGNVRLRLHGEIARIEVDEIAFEQVLQHRRQIVEALKKLGFLYLTLDLEGFRSGSMDTHIKRE